MTAASPCATSDSKLRIPKSNRANQALSHGTPGVTAVRQPASGQVDAAALAAATHANAKHADQRVRVEVSLWDREIEATRCRMVTFDQSQ